MHPLSAGRRGVQREHCYSRRRDMRRRRDRLFVFQAFEGAGRFSALKTDQEALAFFSKYGPFRFQFDWRDHSLPEDRFYEEFVGEPRALTLSEIEQHQERLQQIVLSPPANWLPPKRQGPFERLEELDKLVALGPLPRINPKGGAPPFFTMEATCVRQAIATTIFLDAVAEKPYRRCVRCGTLFVENESRKKRFCNADCSLRVRIARSRERAKKAKIASRANP